MAKISPTFDIINNLIDKQCSQIKYIPCKDVLNVIYTINNNKLLKEVIMFHGIKIKENIYDNSILEITEKLNKIYVPYNIIDNYVTKNNKNYIELHSMKFINTYLISNYYCDHKYIWIDNENDYDMFIYILNEDNLSIFIENSDLI